MVKKKMLPAGLREQMRDLLLLHHSTLYTRQKKRAKTGQQLHIIRSLAEIGKRHSAKDVNKCKGQGITKKKQKNVKKIFKKKQQNWAR